MKKNNQNADQTNSLYESEIELHLVIDNLPSLIAYVDSSRKYRVINRAYQNFFGINEDEFIGKHVAEGLGDQRYKIIKKYIDTVLKGEKTGFEECFKDRNDIDHKLSAKMIPYIDSKGLQNGYLVIVDDITEKNNLKTEIEELNQSLEIKVVNRTQQLQRQTEELQKAINENKILRGILPTCALCKKIRDDTGHWIQIESYIRDHSEAEFSHSICPECTKKLYTEKPVDLHKNNEK